MIGQKFKTGDIVIHRKGGVYTIAGYCTIEATLTPAYVYQDRNGRWWARPKDEMEDGRFRIAEYEDLEQRTSENEKKSP